MKIDRQKVFAKFGGRCAYCGCELEKGWHVDHVEACLRYRETEWDCRNRKVRVVSQGMSKPELNTEDNMFPACPSCNINKHSYTVEQFRESIAGYLRSLNLRMVQYKMCKKYGLVTETGAEVEFYFEKFNKKAGLT